MRDRGSMTAMVVLVGVAVTSVVVSATVPLLVDLRDRQRAVAAADAAALAGVIDGRSAAATVAAANGGTLVGWSETGHDVTVVVTVGSERATARATDAP